LLLGWAWQICKCASNCSRLANFTGWRVSYQKVCKGFRAGDQAVGTDSLTLLVLAVLN
jgi:hypothetical protein